MPSEPRFHLVRRSHDGQETTIPLQGTLEIGREGSGLAITGDRYLSGHHAQVEVRGAEVVLSDRGSRNGTFVEVVRPVRLRHGDVFAVGRQLFRYLE